MIDEFNELLRLVRYRRGEDRLLLLGDLVDKGPDAYGVVRRAQEVGAITLLGNHDDAHVRFWRREQTRKTSGKKNPMKGFLTHSDQRHLVNARFTEDDIKFLDGPLWLPIGRDWLGREWVAVHGGFEPRWKLEEQTREHVVRCRYVWPPGYEHAGEMAALVKHGTGQPPGSLLWAEAWQEPHCVVYGHMVHSLTEPLSTSILSIVVESGPSRNFERLGIDTGCCYGGRLTCLVLDHSSGFMSTVQVRAQKAYAEWFGGSMRE